jgi:type I restriction enzyme, S subunit
MSEATLPDRWELVRLADHTTVKARLGWKGLKAEEYIEDGFIFLATPNLKANQIDFENVNYITKWRYDESPEIQLQIGDVLIVKDGSTLGISNYVRRLPRPTTVNGSIAVVRTRSSLHSEFLYHLVNGNAFQKLIELKKAGLGVPHLFQADLREFFVSLPPLPQQRKIARILTTVDNLIEKTEALIAKYQAIKQGMMHDLFTRGVDDRGHLRPPYEQAPELYKQSELGWNPKEWEVEACGSISREIVVGIVVRPVQYYRPEGVPVLRSANVRKNKVVSDDLVFMSEKDNEALSKSQVNTGDVVTVRTGVGVGSTAVIPDHFDGCNCVDIVITRPKREKIRPEFLSMWINSPQGYAQILAGQGGLAQQHFNVGEMRLMQIKVPELGEQDLIVASIVSQQSSLERTVETVEKLRSLKAGLMQDLLTGKVRVNVDEAEEIAAHA